MKKRSMEELGRMSVGEYKWAKKAPVVLVLDNIRSLNNVGSVFRTSDAFRVSRIMLCGITGTPPHREIQKTALGATESVDWEYYGSTLDAVRALREAHYKVYAVEQVEGSISLENFRPEPGTGYAFVFGNEIHGVAGEILPEVDQCIEIPQFGTKHSFNISISAGIVLWHFHYTTRCE